MKRILITGTTSGLGKETALQLHRQGHHIIMACRNVEKATLLKEEMLGSHPHSPVDVMYLDLSSFEAILSFSKEFYKQYDYLDVLINNAGVFCDTHMSTKEGFEMTMGVNYIGQYLLTKLLLDALKVPEQARIVNVSSKAGFYGKLKIKDKWLENHAHGFKAYSASKMAQLMFTIYYSEQLKDLNITVNAAHPGQVATGIWKGDSLLMKMMIPITKKKYDSPKEACKTTVYLATSKDVENKTGLLFEMESEIMTYQKKVLDQSMIQTLMNDAEELIGPYI